MRWTALALTTMLACGAAMAQEGRVQREASAFDSYRGVVEKTVGMVGDKGVKRFAQLHGLEVQNVTWEDTGRLKNSSVGPNISDMTIQVQLMDPRTEKFSLHCMPVIRFPNFSDLSCDVAPDKFFVLVGNEKGGSLKKVSLTDLLSDLRSHLSRPDSWKGSNNSLLADRDTHVLVSAQACFLPIPKEGSAEFNPVLFNYQSSEKNPAVLTILATREGTSATVIDNTRDRFQAGQTWGQRLFFNQDGKRASLTGKRKSDVAAQESKKGELNDRPTIMADPSVNMVLMIQVPLVHRTPPTRAFALGAAEGAAPPAPAGLGGARGGRSDVEDAVVGHGRVEGPFTEIDDLAVERDKRFPIRVTVQFYKATSNGVASSDDMEAISKQITRVYKDADYVGSLVTEGSTGRPTESQPVRPRQVMP